MIESVEEAISVIEADEEWDDVIDAMEFLAGHAPEKLRPFLRSLSRHKNWVVRCEAIDLIGADRENELADAVRAAFRDPDHNVRAYAIYVLHELNGKSAIPEIQAMENDPDPSVRCACHAARYRSAREEAALQRIRDEFPAVEDNYHVGFCVFSELKECLREGDSRVRSLLQDMARITDSAGVVKAIYGAIEAWPLLIRQEDGDETAADAEGQESDGGF